MKKGGKIGTNKGKIHKYKYTFVKFVNKRLFIEQKMAKY